MTRVKQIDTSAEGFVQEVNDFLKFTGAEPPPPNAIFILVMGVTGSGKSTFISRCSGKPVPIGHDLRSCTEDLSIISFKHPDKVHTIYLIDSPGFDDTEKSDTEILTHVAHYLSVSYANRIHISGIIFMHRISDVRVGGTAKRNINMFKELVGEAAYENVAIATTMWWTAEEEINLNKEKQLQDDHFQSVLQGGAKIFRCTAGPDPSDDKKSKEEAFAILDHLMKRAAAGPVLLRIQHEMVDEGMTLSQTGAGKAVDGEMAAMREEVEQQLKETQKELAAALEKRDSHNAEEYRETEAELNKKNKRLSEDQIKLDRRLAEMYQQEEERLVQRMAEMEQQWQEAALQKQQQLWAAEQELQRMQRAAQELERQRHLQHEQQRQQQQAAAEHQRQQYNQYLQQQAHEAADAYRRQQEMREKEQQQHDHEQWVKAEEARKQQEEEFKKMQLEMQQLQLSIAQKQQATVKVKESLRFSALSGVLKGAASGVVGVAIPAVAAGLFCSVM